jgi:hypothetical protein
MSHVLLINGSLGGNTGNTAELMALAEERLSKDVTVTHLELCREPSMDRILEEVSKADAFIFGTGTYWDSWGSPLQRFFGDDGTRGGSEVGTVAVDRGLKRVRDADSAFGGACLYVGEQGGADVRAGASQA